MCNSNVWVPCQWQDDDFEGWWVPCGTQQGDVIHQCPSCEFHARSEAEREAAHPIGVE